MGRSLEKCHVGFGLNPSGLLFLYTTTDMRKHRIHFGNISTQSYAVGCGSECEWFHGTQIKTGW